MSRIIYVPQYPTPMRYAEWWYWKFQDEFEKRGYDVTVLGQRVCDAGLCRGSSALFSPIESAIELETEQIKEFMNLTLYEDDMLFMSDLSFPGFFANVLHHKRPKKCFAFCHATSLNKLDYFEPVRRSKYPVETGQARIFDKVFVGSVYHAMKLIDWDNVYITYLPEPPETFPKITDAKKKHLFCSASRPNPQKVDEILEIQVEGKFNEIIQRQTSDDWQDYYRFLAKSKILLITSKEETFGYQILDAVRNNCIPVAPDKCSYPELLPKEYLYKDKENLFSIIEKIKNDELGVPGLLCQEHITNFYDRLLVEMEG